MERILLVTRSTMIRKPLAFAIVLMIAALAPAASIIGFCARMPCCAHRQASSLVFATPRADCCTTVACYESPSAKMTKAASSGVRAVMGPAFVSPVAVSPPLQSVAQIAVDTSPPRTVGHRLAVLSILLV